MSGPNAELLAQETLTLAEVHAALITLCDQVQVLTEKLDRAEAQIAHVVELAAPAIEQIAASPLLKMLGGKRV